MYEFGNTVNKTVDALGRIVLPAKWRRGYSKEVILIQKESGRIEIIQKRKGALREIFGTVHFTDDDLKNLWKLEEAGAIGNVK